VSVTAPRGTTFSPTIFYLKPEISEIVPTSGPVGGSVTINGAHFDGITSITIGGAIVTNWDYVTGDRSINAEVPVGAETGPIVVTNAGGSAASQTFTVEPAGAGRSVPFGSARAVRPGVPRD
jgi:hypothetical protein